MSEKKMSRAGLLILLLLWGALVLWAWLRTPQEASLSERRLLAQRPALSVEALLSGDYMRGFEDYATDQFPLREEFRTLKAVSAFYLFRQSDNNDIYIKDGSAVKIEYPLNENSVTSATEKLTDVYEKYLAESGANVYLSIVPDKAYYTAAVNGYPALDYDRLIALAREGMPYAEYIDITGLLDAGDYYATDSHWRQEQIGAAADALSEGMGLGKLEQTYEPVRTDVPFYGVYYGQAALPMEPDEIVYLTNEMLDSCTVYNVETNSTVDVYNLEKLESRDPYEVFLSGAAAILKIENPSVQNGRHLVVFRDSFAGSLMPLLLEKYERVTMIDTRYVMPAMLGQLVDFDADDVLFLYSTSLLNSSGTLR